MPIVSAAAAGGLNVRVPLLVSDPPVNGESIVPLPTSSVLPVFRVGRTIAPSEMTSPEGELMTICVAGAPAFAAVIPLA